MSFLEKKNQTSPDSPLKKRRASWSPLKHAALAMKLQSFATPSSKTKTLIPNFSKIDRTRLLSDNILLRILSKLPDSQRNSNSLVCKRWLNLQGRLFRSLKVTAWEFLESGRLITRFPNLNNVDLVRGCLNSLGNAGVLVNHRMVSLNIDSGLSPNWCFIAENLLSFEMIDRGLRAVASGYPNLWKLVVINASELGLLSVAEECSTLQELEWHKCNDNVLIGISACENLQILRLVANIDGFYKSVVSDIGLTIVAQGCKRLVKLELIGCDGSFHGIKALGQCCQMLEELVVCDHRMEPGWLGALRYCKNLKTLRIVSCKQIDSSPGADEYLGSCPALEQLHLQKCQLRDKKSVKALFPVCEAVKEVVFQDCWGLNDEIFGFASAFRRVEFLSLEGCSLLTTSGLESVILHWQELERLKVMSCRNIKDFEISPALSTLFSALVELQWRPDTRSHLASSLSGTGVGKKGRKFFKKT